MGWQFENIQLPVKRNCISRTSGEGVEETLIVQFGQQWMKSTTDALQDKKEEDDDPSQVTAGMHINKLPKARKMRKFGPGKFWVNKVWDEEN